MQIVVLGMHRSGTSAVTSLLVRMGAHFGPAEVEMAARADNPAGFAERRDVVTINDELLAASGADWNTPLDYDRAKIPPAVLIPLLERARKIVGELSANPLSVIKDPRFCLTSDVWLPLFPQPVCLLVTRNPLAIARSLQQRGDCSVSTGLALWEAYLRASLRVARNFPLATIDYDKLMTGPRAELDRTFNVLRGLGLPASLANPTEQEISESLKADLCHHVSAFAEFTGFATPQQFSLFDELCKIPIKEIPDAAVSAPSQEALRYFASREIAVRRELDSLMKELARAEIVHRGTARSLRNARDRVTDLEAKRDSLLKVVAILMAEAEGACDVVLDAIRRPDLKTAFWLSHFLRRRGVTSADIQAIAKRLSTAWAAGREALDISTDGKGS